MNAQTRILFDCRWLGLGGPGRAGELLLLGLKSLKPEGRWLLWGDPSKLEPHQWQGSEIVSTSHSPLAMNGQRGSFEMPANDVALYVHQIRPLRPGRSVTLIHDTIPLHFGPLRARVAKFAYFKAVAAMSTKIMTVSEHSRRSICTDLSVSPDKVALVHYPVDEAFVSRVNAVKQTKKRENFALYVGRFGRHKNIPRLVQAFERTEFAHAGGRLVVAGGSADEVEALNRRFPVLSSVDVLGHRSQDQLEELYATARLLVLPSMEEGFGLPVWEARSTGLPVCASDRGALPEVVEGGDSLFDPFSIPSIAAAIDTSLARDASVPVEKPRVTDFAGEVIDVLEAALRSG